MAKYAPVGQRGYYNPFTRAANYANPANNRSGKLSNSFSLTCVIIESESALADIDAICATPGVDVRLHGRLRLGSSPRCQWRYFDAPAWSAVVERSISRIRASGKGCGHDGSQLCRHGPSPFDRCQFPLCTASDSS